MGETVLNVKRGKEGAMRGMGEPVSHGLAEFSKVLLNYWFSSFLLLGVWRNRIGDGRSEGREYLANPHSPPP